MKNSREFYEAVVNGEVITDEMREMAASLIEKLDHTNEVRKVKAAEKAAEKQAEKAPIRSALLAVMGGEDNPMTASALIEAAGLDIKPASVPSLLRPFVESGEVIKVDVKITGKGTQRGYVKA